MAYEDFPTQTVEILDESIFNQDGNLNEDFLLSNYGLGAEEAMQIVEFGSYRGTVAQMLNDEGCPVGRMVRDAYKEKGLAGVEEKFDSLAAMDPRAKVVIGQETRQRVLDLADPKKN